MAQHKIVKVLSANDTGETGGHQAGLLIPRKEEILSFFPRLDRSQHNPRAHLHFEDDEGRHWEFAFIYYNNKLFGGTRDEYRLTRMTKYIREAGLKTGDEVILKRLLDGSHAISYRRAYGVPVAEQAEGGTVLQLGSGWKVIDL
ncbi:EcoRII N-terminal effector-binding domain-containing protein [Marinobacter subterrani]|uniref:Restriction endonuclease EcoRII, N-terminal n=1 Tax=Marinobacter subterrani TaxID=1658765 RepID=A0A0J7JD02_9GAMM|nr:EcoRII N-terminal effector-binding domain-containing protein [Marinobacter subterrani]KMQ76388.1 Restriction endonuclease EcoRII, N-terminal [Marinobacter subterrani]